MFSAFSVKKIYLVIFSLFCSTLLFAEDFSGVSVEIRYFDKRLYYPQTGDIFVQVTLTNNSSEPYNFRLSEDRAFSLDFDVRTLANRPVENADALSRKRSGQRQVFFREVTLDTGESLSFTENIRDWRRLDSAGSYVVQAKFYPGLFKAVNAGGGDDYSVFRTSSVGPAGASAGPTAEDGAAMPVLVSNRLNLHIRTPAVLNPDGVPAALDEETQAVYFREQLPPDEVVKWTLTSRQKSQWEKFFLYLDLEQLILNDAARARKWRAESEEGRQRMLTKYREDLRRQTIDGDITAIPYEFQIERTTYNADDGTVSALEKFRIGDYTERKRYTYYLRRSAGIWTIVDYVVQNLGTE
jgi:hypothetical protein